MVRKRRWIRSFREFRFGICQCGCDKPIGRLVFKGRLRKRIPTHWYNTFKTKDGYVYVQRPEHPQSNLAGYILEHRYILSEHLGRPLTEEEEVHHINGVRDDNRVENLRIMDAKTHGKLHYGTSPINRNWHGHFT